MAETTVTPPALAAPLAVRRRSGLRFTIALVIIGWFVLAAIVGPLLVPFDVSARERR